MGASPRTSRLLLWVPLLAVALAACDGTPGRPGARLSGLLIDPQLDEISGLAASRRHAGVLWLHDDGGNPPRLYAVTTRGMRVATFTVEKVAKTDWEDIAAFRRDGHDYLMLADTGDNGGLRRTLQLHAIEEPARLENGRVRPAWSVVFRWPDGARDCEAVAVDANAGEVLLISKKRQPPELFVVPLKPAGSGVQTAKRIGHLGGIPVPDATLQRRAPRRARLSRQVTAADISPDGRQLAVMTYRYLLLYSRHPGESWADATRRAPKVSVLPALPQPEALGWASDGRSLYATGEFIPAPLYRIRP